MNENKKERYRVIKRKPNGAFESAITVRATGYEDAVSKAGFDPNTSHFEGVEVTHLRPLLEWLNRKRR